MRSKGTGSWLGCVLLLASGCSLIANGSDYTGGITVDHDASTDGPIGDIHDQLIGIEKARVEEWCGCFYAFFNFADNSACVTALTPSDAYYECLDGAYAALGGAADSAFACQRNIYQSALDCERAVDCSASGEYRPGEFNQCIFDFQQAIYSTAGCFTAAYDPYFQQKVQCARDHVVGTPSASCPGSPLLTSTAVGSTIGAGSHFDLVNSECFPHVNDAPVNLNTADQFVQWSPSQTGRVVVDTIGTNFDTIMYVTDSCSAVDAETCNDDIAFGSGILQSRIEVGSWPQGEAKLIVVEGYSPADFGAVRLNFTALWCADNAALPLDIPTHLGSMAFTGSTVATSRFNPVTASCATSVDVPDAVLAWRPPLGGTYAIDTAGSNFDTVLYLRRSCDTDQGVYHEDACNDNAADLGSQSRITVSLMAQETILIVVDGASGASGNYQVNITKLD
jgi:hypothetical protein